MKGVIWIWICLHTFFLEKLSTSMVLPGHQTSDSHPPLRALTFVLRLQHRRRRVPPQVQVRVLHLLCRRGLRAVLRRRKLATVPPQLSVLRLQLLDLVAHLHDDVRQAAGAVHAAAGALPVPRLPEHRRTVVQEELTALLGLQHVCCPGLSEPLLLCASISAQILLRRQIMSPVTTYAAQRAPVISAHSGHNGCFINQHPASGFGGN